MPHYRPLVWTAAYVGMRWGELAGLRVTKVDLLRKTLVADEQLTEVAGDLRSRPPKTKAGTRRVTIPSVLTEILGEHFATDRVQSSGLAFRRGPANRCAGPTSDVGGVRPLNDSDGWTVIRWTG